MCITVLRTASYGSTTITPYVLTVPYCMYRTVQIDVGGMYSRIHVFERSSIRSATHTEPTSHSSWCFILHPSSSKHAEYEENSPVIKCLLNSYHAWKNEEEKHKPMPVTCAGMFHRYRPSIFKDRTISDGVSQPPQEISLVAKFNRSDEDQKLPRYDHLVPMRAISVDGSSVRLEELCSRQEVR